MDTPNPNAEKSSFAFMKHSCRSGMLYILAARLCSKSRVGFSSTVIQLESWPSSVEILVIITVLPEPRTPVII